MTSTIDKLLESTHFKIKNELIKLGIHENSYTSVNCTDIEVDVVKTASYS